MNPAGPTTTTTTTISSSPTCGFNGNSDIYGLGIRIGIYLQWLAAIIAELASPANVEAAQATAASYQLAMLSGLILVTQDRTLGVLAVEAFLMQLFCFAGVWVASAPAVRSSGLFATVWPRGAEGGPGLAREDRVGGGGGALSGLTRRRSTTTSAGLFRQLLGCVVCAYGTWTLFVGLDVLPRTACDEVAFFFAPVRLFGWFRDMLKAFFIIGLTASSLVLGMEVVQRSTVFVVALREWPPAPMKLSSLAAPEDHTTAARLRGGKKTVLLRQSLSGIIALSLFVVSVELTLSWNAVRGVYGCGTFGQLFPLALSASNLVGVCRQVATAIMSRNMSFKF